MSETPAPGFHLTPQSTFPTTEDARASYGFAQPEAAALDNAGYMTATAETVALRQQLAEAKAAARFLGDENAELLAAVSEAEARVKEQQAELGDQERDKLALITGIKDLCGTLYWATNAWTAELLAMDVRKKLRALLAGQSSPIELLNPAAK